MNKRVKENEIVCDSCGFYFDEFFIYKHISGNNYCGHCIALSVRAQAIKKQIKPKEVDKMARALLKTPPRKKRNKKESNFKH